MVYKHVMSLTSVGKHGCTEQILAYF